MNNLYRKIDKIAKKGSDNYINYHTFVDDCVTRNQYWLLQQVLYHKYEFDVENYSSVNTMKAPSWTVIIQNTYSNLQEKKAELLTKNSVYQLGITYYGEIPVTATATNPLGTIEEVDYFDEEVTFDVSQAELQKIVGNKRTYLIATSEGATQSASFSSWSEDSRYDKNVLNLYSQAINYLI